MGERRVSEQCYVPGSFLPAPPQVAPEPVSPMLAVLGWRVPVLRFCNRQLGACGYG